MARSAGKSEAPGKRSRNGNATWHALASSRAPRSRQAASTTATELRALNELHRDLSQLIAGVERTARRLESRAGRDPTLNEVAAELHRDTRRQLRALFASF